MFDLNNSVLNVKRGKIHEEGTVKFSKVNYCQL